MKALFTSLLLLSIVTVQANSANTDSTNTGKKTEVGPDSNPSNTASVQQLQQENSELKLKMASLETKFEDQVGLLNYKFTMSNLLAKVDEKNQLEKLEDLKSKLEFSQMMSTTLFLLKNETTGL